MLRGLDIRDMLIISRLELAFQPGLNVLTGETGAGKSILLDSLGFVLGWRGRSDLVRAGAETGEVSAWFDLPDGHPARAVLQEAGLPDGDELVLRRVNTTDGRKTAWVNDRRVSGEVLRALSDVLVELHGQHDDRGLLNPRGHRAILDDYAGHDPALSRVRAAWAALREATKAEKAAQEALEAARADEDFLNHALAELEKLAPEPGEEAELDARRRLMQAAGRIAEDVAKAHAALGLNGAEGAMTDAMRWLEGVTDKAEGHLEDPLAALERALTELGEAASGVERCIDALRFDPTELETTEERLFALRALARKHGVAPDELSALTDELRIRRATLDGGTAELDRLETATRNAQTAYDKAAGMLTKARKSAAAQLDKAMAAELAPLKMERAEFSTQVDPDAPGPDGSDAVAFQVATNPGAPAGPLARIASGGELSRFLLALKVCLAQGQPGLTLIFDEIDRGVGGATADAVGRRLAALAEGGQVLVVTHSPQVAARGAHHWQVRKEVTAGQTESSVLALEPSARIDEIARMLSGDTVTDEARKAAQALLRPVGA